MLWDMEMRVYACICCAIGAFFGENWFKIKSFSSRKFNVVILHETSFCSMSERMLWIKILKVQEELIFDFVLMIVFS